MGLISSQLSFLIVGLTEPLSQGVTALHVSFDSAVPETPPRNCSAVAVSSTVISLSWVLPLVPNGLIENYDVSYRPLQSRSGIDYTTSGLDDVIQTANNSTTLLIDQLFEATSYSFTITAFTIVGPGPTSGDGCVMYTEEDGEVLLQLTCTLPKKIGIYF